MVDKYHFIITNLDAQTIDLEPFQYSGANITILRMIDTTSNPIIKYAEYVNNLPKDMKPEAVNGDTPEENPNNEDVPKDDDNESIEPKVDEDGEKQGGEGEEEEKEENGEEEKGEEEIEAEGKLKMIDLSNFNQIINSFTGFNLETVRLQTALLYDGVILLAETFKQLGFEQIQAANVYCTGNESMWEKGLSISNFLRNVCFGLIF